MKVWWNIAWDSGRVDINWPQFRRAVTCWFPYPVSYCWCHVRVKRSGASSAVCSTHLCSQPHLWPREKGLGGGFSVSNGLVYPPPSVKARCVLTIQGGSRLWVIVLINPNLQDARVTQPNFPAKFLRCGVEPLTQCGVGRCWGGKRIVFFLRPNQELFLKWDTSAWNSLVRLANAEVSGHHTPLSWIHICPPVLTSASPPTNTALIGANYRSLSSQFPETNNTTVLGESRILSKEKVFEVCLSMELFSQTLPPTGHLSFKLRPNWSKMYSLGEGGTPGDFEGAGFLSQELCSDVSSLWWREPSSLEPDS